MKFIVFAAIVSIAVGGRVGRLGKHSVLASGAVANTKNEQECSEQFSKFIPKSGLSKTKVPEAAQDYCAREASAEHSYSCPHFTKFVEDALVDFVKEEPLSASDICQHTEHHLHELRVQSVNVPNVGNGTLDKPIVHGDCIPAMEEAMKDKKEVPSDAVPSFWYTFCVSQDCAHFLPSRHRFCETNHAPTPTHSNALCVLVQDFAKDNLGSSASSWGPKELCNLYDGFMEKSLHNAEAYEYVIHALSKENIPEPNDPTKALLHSQLTNTASAHYLRDNSAKPVKPQDKSGAHGLGLGLRLGQAFCVTMLVAVGATSPALLAF